MLGLFISQNYLEQNYNFLACWLHVQNIPTLNICDYQKSLSGWSDLNAGDKPAIEPLNSKGLRCDKCEETSKFMTFLFR